jgi:hypothetical protein
VNDEEIISDESSDNTDTDGIVDKDDAEGHVEAFGSKQEKWQVDSKTISIEQSLTQRMRNKFSQYSDLDESGNVQYNMWGIRKRVPVETACKKLSHWLNQALSFSEMKAILKKKEMNNPWIA